MTDNEMLELAEKLAIKKSGFPKYANMRTEYARDTAIELSELQRKDKEQAVIDAALDLCVFMSVSGLKLKIPGTDPPVFIVVGDREGISSLFSLDTGSD